jgi:hypothetical protein
MDILDFLNVMNFKQFVKKSATSREHSADIVSIMKKNNELETIERFWGRQWDTYLLTKMYCRRLEHFWIPEGHLSLHWHAHHLRLPP